MTFTEQKNTGLFYKSAKELFLPVEVVPCIAGFRFQLGNKTYFFREFEMPFNNTCSTRIAENKHCTNKILESAGIPVPKSAAIHIDQFKANHVEAIIEHLTFPLVLKPTLGSLGRNVYCNIPDIEQLKTLMTKCFSTDEWLTVEEFHGNLNSYRVLVFKKQIIGIVQRYPAHVIGDGTHTITELVKRTNLERLQLGDEFAPIILDEECHIRFRELGITPEYIPKNNERIVLCYTCNASRGGTFREISTKISKANSKLFIKIATLLNLNIAGIDIECVDINSPHLGSEGVIIEVNSGPSIRIHENNLCTKPNRITKKMVRSIIYQHPLSFMLVLYKNKSTAMYVKIFILLLFSGLFYGFLKH
jgi:D-alanine-D-alanine ligase-like ATP-grasp enzyme